MIKNVEVVVSEHAAETSRDVERYKAKRDETVERRRRRKFHSIGKKTMSFTTRDEAMQGSTQVNRLGFESFQSKLSCLNLFHSIQFLCKIVEFFKPWCVYVNAICKSYRIFERKEKLYIMCFTH